MKNSKTNLIVVVTLIIGVTIFVSCEKNAFTTSNEANQTVSEISYKAAGKGKLKIRKGTHIERLDCTKNLPCGPCPGICIRWEKPAEPTLLSSSYELTQNDIDNNLTLIELEKIDASSFRISVLDNTESYYENKLIFDEDVNLGSNVADGFGYNTLTIVQGEYPVDFTNNPEGEVIVNVITN